MKKFIWFVDWWVISSARPERVNKKVSSLEKNKKSIKWKVSQTLIHILPFPPICSNLNNQATGGKIVFFSIFYPTPSCFVDWFSSFSFSRVKRTYRLTYNPSLSFKRNPILGERSILLLLIKKITSTKLRNIHSIEKKEKVIKVPYCQFFIS